MTPTTKKTAAKPRAKAAHKAAASSAEHATEVKKEHAAHHRGKYVYAVGRRKTATAKVRLFEGAGDITVNKKPAKDYFNWQPWQKAVAQPLTAVGAEKNFDVVAEVFGGGLHAQAEAVALGIARTLITKDEGYKKVLKTQGLLTRDPRMKERKKPGLKKARRAPQWSKR